MAEMTLIFTGVRCDICNFVWLAGVPRDMPKQLECPRCKQMADYAMVSLDDFKDKRDEAGEIS